MTCCSCTRLPITAGRLSANSVSRMTRCRWSSLRVKARTSRVASLRSTHSLAPVLLAEERAQPRDDLGGPLAVADGPPRGFARAGDVGRIRGEHPQARARVGDDAGERLVDLVCDRRGQGSEGGDPGDVRQLGMESGERRFGLSPFGDVLDGADVLHLAPAVAQRVSCDMHVLDRSIGQQQATLELDDRPSCGVPVPPGRLSAGASSGWTRPKTNPMVNGVARSTPKMR